MKKIVRKYRSVFVEGRFTPWVITLIVLILRTTMFIHRGTFSLDHPDTGYVWRQVAPYFSNAWISFSASTLCIFIIAFIIGEIDRKFAIIRGRTSLPFTITLLFFTVHPFFLTFSADLVALICVLIAFFPLLRSYQKTLAKSYALKIGILLSFAAIFQIYALLLIPVFWLGEVSMRGFRFRAFFASLFGMALVFWSVFTVYFFFDKADEFLHPFYYFTQISLPDFTQFSIPQLGLMGITTLSIFIFMIVDYPFFSRGKVLAKNTIDFLIRMILLNIVFGIAYSQSTSFFLYAINAMFSFIVAQYYSYTTSPKAISVFFLLAGILFLIYLMNYSSIFFPIQ